MKKHKILTILFLLLVLLFAVWQIFKGDENKDKPQVVEPAKNNETEKIAEEPANYSRVTFFHTQPLKCSLAVPEEWEGKYRVKDGSQKAAFYYVANPGEETELFFINAYTDEQKISQNEDIVLQKNKNTYTFQLSTVNNKDINKLNEYREMQITSKDLAKTLKCFSLD